MHYQLGALHDTSMSNGHRTRSLPKVTDLDERRRSFEHHQSVLQLQITVGNPKSMAVVHGADELRSMHVGSAAHQCVSAL